MGNVYHKDLTGDDLHTNKIETNNPKNKFDATTAPDKDNDTSEDYTVGSRWCDVTHDKEYVCLNNTDGAAVWQETTRSPKKWSGLQMNILSTSDNNEVLSPFFNNWVDELLADGFTQLRIGVMDFRWENAVVISKQAVGIAVAKGVQVIWGVGIGGTTITSANWEECETAIEAAATWAQANGVYEFQLGNEECNHNDDDTLTDAQLITNLKSVATEVQAIFTNGNVSYSCFHENIDDWISAGKGDIDMLASNVYMEWGAGHNPIDWKGEIDDLVGEFGVDGTYLTEFSPNTEGLNVYSTNEVEQAIAMAEMLEYIKKSGMKRAFFFTYYDDPRPFCSAGFGVLKTDKTYRLLWHAFFGLYYNVPITITSQATGDILYFDGRNWIRLAKGTAGQVLTMNGGATAPEWQTP